MKKYVPLFSALLLIQSWISYANCPNLSGLYEAKVIEESNCDVSAQYLIAQVGCDKLAIRATGDQKLVRNSNSLGLNYETFGDLSPLHLNGSRKYLSSDTDIPAAIRFLLPERNYKMKEHWERKPDGEVTGLIKGSFTVVSQGFNSITTYENFCNLDLNEFTKEKKITIHWISMIPVSRSQPENGVVRCETKLVLTQIQ